MRSPSATPVRHRIGGENDRDRAAQAEPGDADDLAQLVTERQQAERDHHRPRHDRQEEGQQQPAAGHRR